MDKNQGQYLIENFIASKVYLVIELKIKISRFPRQKAYSKWNHKAEMRVIMNQGTPGDFEKYIKERLL